MSQTIIYTFDKGVFPYGPIGDNILGFYSKSIESVTKLGYKTEMYTNCDWFDGKVNKVNYVDDTILTITDYFKCFALNRSDDFVLIDPDIIVHDNIPFNEDYDVYFDTWESWKEYHETPVKLLTELGIGDFIPEWSFSKQRVMNGGLLKINNQELKNLWVDRCNLFRVFIEENKHLIPEPIYKVTPAAGQYLLTLLCNHYQFTRFNFSRFPRERNQYYQHFTGDAKLKNKITTNKTSLI